MRQCGSFSPHPVSRRARRAGRRVDPERSRAQRHARRLAADQWNFLPGTGVDAPRAWDNLIAAGRPGGRGVRIAVLDSGRRLRGREVPLAGALAVSASCAGHDFCPRAGAARTRASAATRTRTTRTATGRTSRARSPRPRTTATALTGLAYGATIMPVKVLNRRGDGDEETIADGIRYAGRRGAQVINLSFEFGRGPSGRRDPAARGRGAPRALQGRADRRRRRATSSFDAVSYPAALPGVLSVGAVTEHGCLAEYANTGAGTRHRRARAAATTRAARRARLPPDGPPAARSCSSRSPATAHVRLPARLLRHVDGGAARGGDGRADDRLGRARAEAVAARRSRRS